MSDGAPGSSGIIASYDALVAQSKTVNDLNRIHIAFGNTITPQEVLVLEEALFVDGVHQAPPPLKDRNFTDEDLRRNARVWIEELRADLKRVRKADAEPFLRRDIRKSVTLYHSGASPKGRSLLVAFPGANHRLMMPISTLLQNIPARTVDVLMIRDGTRSGYTAGLEGLAPSIEQLGASLPSVVDLGGYDRLLGLGVSAGGLPIILVALQLDFDAVLACGPSSPSRPNWQRPGMPSPVETLRGAAADGRNRRITIAYGAQSEPDRDAALEIARHISVEPIEVSSPECDVRHNVLHPLSLYGTLPTFLQRHLGIEP